MSRRQSIWYFLFEAHIILKRRRVHDQTPGFQIPFAGSGPRVVGSSWRSFPGRGRLYESQQPLHVTVSEAISAWLTQFSVCFSAAALTRPAGRVTSSVHAARRRRFVSAAEQADAATAPFERTTRPPASPAHPLTTLRALWRQIESDVV